MKFPYSIKSCNKLDKTIQVLCPFIEKQINTQHKSSWSEFDLRRELVACILGSQVRYETALKALLLLEQADLLNDDHWAGSAETFEDEVFNVLSGQTLSSNEKWCYRFPKVRSKQISKTRDRISDRSLSDRISEFRNPKKLRAILVNEIPGLGPKQASMFLRNIGISYDLAILDTHVLNYMDLKNLLSLKKVKVNTIKNYEQSEKIVNKYAKKIGYPVGFMDWALWATMRAAKELAL